MPTKAPAAPKNVPTISLLEDDAAAYAAVTASRAGRTAVPSVYAAPVTAAKHGTWYKIVPTAAYPAKLIIRELKKAERQYNAVDGNTPITVTARNMDDSTNPFVAWMVNPKPSASPGE